MLPKVPRPMRKRTSLPTNEVHQDTSFSILNETDDASEPTESGELFDRVRADCGLEAWSIVSQYSIENIHRMASQKGFPRGKIPVMCAALDKVDNIFPDAKAVLKDASEKAFDSADPAVKMTEAFVSYIKQSCLSSSGPESIDWSAVEETQTIHVDYPSLLTSESLKKRIADWPTDANGESPPNARVILQSLGLAVHTVASRQIDMDSAPGKEFLHPWLRVHHSQLGFVAVRLLGHFPTLPMRSLRANHLGRLVSIRGTVARLGPIKPLCIRLAFRCLVCENEQVLVLGEDGCFIQPTKCPEKGCRSKSFVPLFESASTRVVDTRSMILQESEEGFADERDNRSNLQMDSTGSFPTSSSSSGRVPRSIPCSLDRDLVSGCVPGDFVHVVGVVSLLPAESSVSQSGSSHQPISSLESGRRCAQANFFNICLRVNNMTLIYGRSGGSTDSGDSNDGGQIHGGIHRGAVQCLTSRNASLGDVQSHSDLVNPSQAMVSSKSDSYFSLSDLYAIRGLSESQDLFRLLIASFCPSICGRELVKMAIMLTLLGASTLSPSVDLTRAPEEDERSPSLSLSSDADSCEELQTDRSDPGIGKSQLLRAAANVAPRAVYVCGNATSAAGLTVSTGRDQSGSGFGLEAGALVLADQGCCCIDEFDKISCDPASLLEVLEQQTVSVARGGFVCNLAARTSVMAAANPVVGHYDASKSVEENVRISRSLLSRFDLIFILPDRPSEGQDRRLSEHILSLHTGKQRDRFVFGGNVSAADASAIGEDSKESLEVRLQLPSDFDYSRLISPILLRKYIAYARRYVHPRLTERAARVLRDYYIELRKLRRDQDVFRATIRQLESLLRLASARARAELREEILEEDAKDVCDLMKETLFGAPVPPGVCDVSVCSLGRKRKPVNATGPAAAKRLLSILETEAARPGCNRMFTTQEIANFAGKLGLSGNDSILYQTCLPDSTLSVLIDRLNHAGALIKRGPDLYSLI
ncbi:DNA replication licensing factor mcm8 [Sparganum proliferum]